VSRMLPGAPRQRPPDPFADPIATALVDVIFERGYEAATLEAVTERAKVSREEFEVRFAGVEDCVQKSLEAFIADFMWRVQMAYDSQPDWRSSLRAAAYAAGAWVEEHPRVTHFGAVGVLSAENEMTRVRREQFFEYCAGLIDAGREEAADPSRIPDAAPLMAIGSIAQMLTSHVHRGEDLKPELERVMQPMIYQTVRPYVGEEAAREELTMPPPQLPDWDEPG
jgi:AcrR family transcriptional regulator